MVGEIVLLGMANWLATLLIVESELFRPLREWIFRHWQNAIRFDSDFTATELMENVQVLETFHESYLWRQAKYLVNCHLCVGVWVGFAEALVLVHPLIGSGVVGIVLTALVFKAIGHATLEVVAVLKGHNS